MSLIETITTIDHGLASTYALDAGRGQVGDQLVDVGKDEHERDEMQVRSADVNLQAHSERGDALPQRNTLM